MKKLLTITTLVAIGGIIALFLFSSIGYRDTTIARQNHIQESYNQNRSHLAGYAREVETNTGLANLHMAKNTEFMKEAISGRYDNKNSSADANKTGTFFSAMHEAYPNLPESMYPAIVKEVEVQEAKFQNDQNDLSDAVANFDTWTQTTVHAMYNMLPWCHFPTERLTALGPNGTTLHGTAALDQMRALVTSKESDDAYHSNEFNGPQLPKN